MPSLHMYTGHAWSEDKSVVLIHLAGSEEAFAASTLLVLDLIGTVAGVRVRLDLFGVLVLSFAAATARGIMRDLLIGAIPPAAISDWQYVAASLLKLLLSRLGVFSCLFS